MCPHRGRPDFRPAGGEKVSGPNIEQVSETELRVALKPAWYPGTNPSSRNLRVACTAEPGCFEHLCTIWRHRWYGRGHARVEWAAARCVQVAGFCHSSGRSNRPVTRFSPCCSLPWAVLTPVCVIRHAELTSDCGRSRSGGQAQSLSLFHQNPLSIECHSLDRSACEAAAVNRSASASRRLASASAVSSRARAARSESAGSIAR